MNKIYHLSNCSTCQRIIAELNNGEGFEMQNIKEQNISAKTLDQIAKQTGSYEAIFSKRAMKYRGLGLHEQTLTEKDFRSWILKEYTFLKRPVVLIDDTYYVGNSKKVVAAAVAALQS